MEESSADRLLPLDSAFLLLEDGVTHMHIGACAIFEGPTPRYEDVVALIAAKLPTLGHYRQHLRVSPAQFRRPVWVDTRQFDLIQHVHRADLRRPGGEDELRQLMGQVMAVELDRRLPLWELWVVDGLVGNRWALIFKVHHCMADGISGTDLLASLLDIDREPTSPLAPEGLAPAPGPLHAARVRGARPGLLSLRSGPRRTARARRRPRRVANGVHDVVIGAMTMQRDLRPAVAPSMEGVIGPRRRWAVARGNLDDLNAVRAVLGGTVNDVVLAVVTGAFRDLLSARGDDLDHTVLRSLVPVSVRPAGDHTTNNQLAAMIVELPVHVADPLERFIAVRNEMHRVKASHETKATVAISEIARFVPPALFALGLRSTTSILRLTSQHRVNTVTTNVPGPRVPLYALGREMLEYLPFVPIAQGLPIATAVISYNRQVRFGVTGDDDTVPELAWFCSRIEEGITELAHRVAGIAHGADVSRHEPTAASVSRIGSAPQPRAD